MRNTARIPTVAAVILVLVGMSCGSHEPRLYRGKVVDENGRPLSGVSVTLCYVGWHWDWDMPGGFPLTWDHLYCSDTVLTDQHGDYRVFFAGAPGTTVRARHRDWIQTRTVSARERRVVLVRREIDQQRQARREAARKQRSWRRRPGESSIDYYCRVVRGHSGTVELYYQGERLKVTQALLLDSRQAILAVMGSDAAVRAMAGELVVGAMGVEGVEPLLDHFTVLSGEPACDRAVHFLVSAPRDSRRLAALNRRQRVHAEVPSLRAGFPMRLLGAE